MKLFYIILHLIKGCPEEDISHTKKENVNVQSVRESFLYLIHIHEAIK